MTTSYNDIHLCVYRKGKGDTVRVYTDAYLLRILKDFYEDYQLKGNALNNINNGLVDGNVLRFTNIKGQNYLESILPKKCLVPLFKKYIQERGLSLTMVSKGQFNLDNYAVA